MPKPFEQMSDAELDAALAQTSQQQASPSMQKDPSQMTDAELDVALAQSQPESDVAQGIRHTAKSQLEESFPARVGNFVSAAVDTGLGALGTAAEYYDRPTGAPVRSALSSAIKGEDPVAAYVNQFGRSTETAPTGKDISEQLGVTSRPVGDFLPNALSKEPSGRGQAYAPIAKFFRETPVSSVTGLGVEVGTDPLSFAGPVARGIGAISKAAKIPELAKAAGATKAGQKSVKLGETFKNAIPAVKAAASDVSYKIGNMLTGVPEQEIKTLVRRGDEVDNIIKSYGKDIPEAADELRDKFQSQIQARRMELNKQISTVLNESPELRIQSQGVVDELQKAFNELDEVYDKDQIPILNEIINDVKKKITEDGTMSLTDLFKTKQYLQDKASFMSQSDIFPKASRAEMAATKSSRSARLLINETSPEIAKANNVLSQMHNIENKMNKNIITSGKPESALLSAGSGINRNRKNLQRLEKLVNGDFVSKAEELSTARSFVDPRYSTVENTGKDISRFVRGGSLGALIGGLIGGAPGALVGGTIGAGATSPAALKALIATGKGTAKASKGVSRILGKIPGKDISKILRGASAVNNVKKEKDLKGE